jgi:hypothetical protein
MSEEVPTTKICTKCKLKKPLEDFSKHKGGRFGRESICRSCKKLYYQENLNAYKERDSKHYREHREARLATMARHYEENQEKILAYWHEFNQRNRERIAVRSAQYYENHREEHLARMREWVKNNPLIKLKHDQKRRATKALVYQEPIDYENILLRDDMVCRICHGEIEDFNDLDFDHWIPLKAFGPHCELNLRCTHKKCNISKHAKVPEFEELPSELILKWGHSIKLTYMRLSLILYWQRLTFYL